MGADSVADRLAEITAPALVVHGTADLPIPPEAGTALAAGLPAAEPVRLLDRSRAHSAGHDRRALTFVSRLP
ncbi:hypothetical protein GCM10022222_66560 [Amycolatopsis ultiminotia]|uniref:Peptidase S33 tripeptidyl aminopeptidase-like C-terminal domain-containing protein n=1 Tax=Amycolatopsis ultiminotia TaxID=543629 RepID=A0ABP6Y0I2_9PSEU